MLCHVAHASEFTGDVDVFVECVCNVCFFFFICLLLCVLCVVLCVVFFFQAEDGIRDLVRSRGLGDVYKRQWPDGSKIWLLVMMKS